MVMRQEFRCIDPHSTYLGDASLFLIVDIQGLLRCVFLIFLLTFLVNNVGVDRPQNRYSDVKSRPKFVQNKY